MFILHSVIEVIYLYDILKIVSLWNHLLGLPSASGHRHGHRHSLSYVDSSVEVIFISISEFYMESFHISTG